jgi:hypothetical protein
MSGRPGRLVVAVLVGLLVVASVPAGTVVAAGSEQVIGRPGLDLAVADDRLHASERRTLEVTVTNGGEVRQSGPASFVQRVTTARNVRLEVLDERIDAPIEFESGTVALGTASEARPATARFTVETGADLRPGVYEIPVEVRYDFTSIVTYDAGENGPENVEFADSFRRETLELRLVVEREPAFEITDERTEGVFVDDTGRLDFTLTNTGTERARDVTVGLSTATPNLFFGPSSARTPSTSVFVESLASGESRDVSVQVGASAEIAPGSYPVDVTVSYENPNGIVEEADPLTAGVTVRPERRFELRGLVAERVRVDEDDGRIEASIVNTGEASARNVVVRLRTAGPIEATGPETAVGDLAPGESAAVDFSVSVAGDAEPGVRSFEFDVEYENADGDLRTTSTPLREPVAVGPELDAFEVVGVTTTLTAGGSERVEVELRNAGDAPATDAEAKLFVADPLSSSDNGAFLGTVQPGETVTAVFQVSAGGDAQAKRYTSAVEVRYDDADGDTELVDGLRAGIPVGPAEGGLPIPFVTAGALVGVGAVGVTLWRRRLDRAAVDAADATATDGEARTRTGTDSPSDDDAGDAESDP